MRMDRALPRARQEGLLEEAVDAELILYDQSSHIAHCLSPIAAAVWRHCNGRCDVDALAQLVGVSDDLVANVLQELEAKDLLDGEQQLEQGDVRISRRDALGRAARYGVAATAGSLVVSAIASTPAMASSGTFFCSSETASESDICCLCINANFCFSQLSVKTPQECEAACVNGGSKMAQFKKRSICL